jgi:hypothetical protein
MVVPLRAGGPPRHHDGAQRGGRHALPRQRGADRRGEGLCTSNAGDINSIQRFGVAPSAAHAAAIAVTVCMDQELQQHGASLHGVCTSTSPRETS